ncbi:glutathione S-transferase [Neptunicoccus sediminis]|uniref:glutathione S-transferase n=1 Tax=Neptunicoccus sediminis TaxID=1892596 RepID=UPI000845F012|nr:glutathione S-transferase [Neptunicoccus sediminis]
MKYELAIADKTYSSWSLRGWLLFEKFAIPVSCQSARMYQPAFHQMLEDFQPARLVPAMKFDGIVVQDSFAMAETLAEQNPDIRMWPADPAARALARSVTAEMHASFNALRDACTMNLRRHYPDFQPSPAVLKDAERMAELWAFCRATFGQGGPWLFGKYSIADVFYAPAASRFATYNLPQSATADAYITAHLSDPAFRRWRAMGIAQNYIQPGYDLDLPQGTWPGPTPLPARSVDAGPSENASCPYSGKPVSDFLELDGRVFGFCNSFCRDKTVADPQAWDDFMKIYQK